MIWWYMIWYDIQLTNGIPWNGKFYYWDVIKITINYHNGQFYHIELHLPKQQKDAFVKKDKNAVKL